MRELPLLILVTLFRFSADDKQPGKYVCTTPLSGIYSPALRYIVYAFFFIAFALRSFEWAVGPSLATAMLYSATASIHSIPIAAQRNNSGFLNPDVYPTVALTIFSLLAALPVLMWSSSFRDQAREHVPQRAETKRRHRLIVHLWVTLLFVGIISSWITSVHPVPLVDDPEACKDGIALKIHEKPLMVRLGGASDTFGTILNVCLVILVVNLVLAFLCSTSQQNPLLLTRGLNGSWTYRFCGHGVVFFIVVLLGLVCIIVGLYIVACLERAMLEDNGWPCGESITNVGQWGEVAHILLALVGFAIMRVRRVDESNQYNPHQPIDSAQVGSFGGG